MSRFSLRTSWDVSESTYAAAVREARASHRHIYDLTISNPTRCGFDYPSNLLRDALEDSRALTYDPDPRGILPAREAVAAYYADHAAEISPADLILTTSTSESYSFLFRLLCDPGDEVLVAQPSYPLFDFLADLDNVRLHPYPLFYDHGWWIDLAELERAITPRTKAIIVVHPNNPTGHWTRMAEREALHELCARHQLALIVDEVFLDYPLQDNVSAKSFACGPQPVLTFVLSGLSKIAALPQMKVAWISTLGPAPIKEEALGRLEIIADTFLSMNAPVQWALPVWLGQRWLLKDQIQNRAQRNLGILHRFEAESTGQLQVLPTEAGWSAVLNLAHCVGEATCAERMVRERDVILHPGSFYGMTGLGRVVASLIGPSEAFEAGIRKAISSISERS